jgi:L-asparaginase II
LRFVENNVANSPSSPFLPAMRALVTRNGFAESEHLADGVIIGTDGSIERGWGNPLAPVFPRSACKPLLAAGMVRAGLHLRGKELAIVASSHSGQPEHVELVNAILAGAGLCEDDLANAPGLPYQVAARDAWLAAGNGPSHVTQNCSGKHTGMLMTAQILHAPLAGYTAWEHPVQQAAFATVRELAEEPCQTHGVDGCGAPVVAMSLVALARAYAKLATGVPGSAENAVADAMSHNPFYVAGKGRDVTAFMEAVPGAITKDGAEGVHVLALPDGRAAALKVRDGAERARPAFLIALVADMGMSDVASALPIEPITGGGQPVGAIQAEIPR